MQPQQLPGFVYSQQKYDPNAYFDILEKSQRSRREQEQLAKKLKAELARAPQSKKGSGRLGSNPLSAFISEGAGAGGALGGAAAGAALGSVVPGIGNIIGGIGGGLVGGFLGGFGGKAAENQLRDNEMRLGDALGEGALSGAFGAAGPAWQSVRGLSTLGKATGAGFGKATAAGANALSNVTDDAARAALGQSLQRGGAKAARGALSGVDELGRVTGAGRSITSNAMGIGQGAKAPGMEAIGAGQSDELLGALKQFGIKPNSPEKVQRALEPIIDRTGKEIADHYAASGVKYTTQQMDSLYDDVLTTLINDPGVNLNKQAWNQLGNQLNLMKQATTPEELWKYQKNLGKSINFGKSASSKLVDREAVARVLRDKVGTLLDDTVKEAAGSRSAYNKAKTADSLLRTASKQSDKSGLTARVMTSQPVRSAEAKVGNFIEGAGNVLSNPVVSNTGRLGRGMATRGIAGALGGAGAMQPEANDDDQLMQLYEQFSSGGGEFGGGETEDIFSEALINPGAGGGQGKTYSLQDALGEAQKLLGPNESPASYLSYAKELMTQSEGPGGGKDYTTGAVSTLTDFDAGISDLQNLAQSFDSSSISDPLLGRVRGLNPYDTKAQSLQAEIDRVRQVVGRALEGGVLRKEDEEKYKKILPTIRDKPEVVRYKLNSVLRALQQKRQTYMSNYQQYGGAGEGPNLSAALSQAGY